MKEQQQQQIADSGAPIAGPIADSGAPIAGPIADSILELNINHNLPNKGRRLPNVPKKIFIEGFLENLA
ncbi:hypothetical protein RYX36_009271 [Vicia faba]